MRKEGIAWEVAYEAYKVATQKKATHPIIIEVGSLLEYIEYFVICSGNSELHVRAIADLIRENLKKGRDIIPCHTEGYREGKWVLLDYDSVVIHIFHDTLRQIYKIEELWEDAPKFF